MKSGQGVPKRKNKTNFFIMKIFKNIQKYDIIITFL